MALLLNELADVGSWLKPIDLIVWSARDNALYFVGLKIQKCAQPTPTCLFYLLRWSGITSYSSIQSVLQCVCVLRSILRALKIWVFPKFQSTLLSIDYALQTSSYPIFLPHTADKQTARRIGHSTLFEWQMRIKKKLPNWKGVHPPSPVESSEPPAWQQGSLAQPPEDSLHLSALHDTKSCQCIWFVPTLECV